jgi:putative transposase
MGGQGAEELGRLQDGSPQRPPGRFPRLKKQGHAPDACRFTTGQIKVLGDASTSSSLGSESSSLTSRPASLPAAWPPPSAVQADRWFVSFTVEVQRRLPTGNGRTTVVGVDVGIRHLAVLSTGAVIANPRLLERQLCKLRRLSRQLARRKPESSRRRQTRRQLAQVHPRAANLRRDALHKLTTTLATEYGTVVVEHLNVAGMTRNRRLARALSDSGIAELRRP